MVCNKVALYLISEICTFDYLFIMRLSTSFIIWLLNIDNLEVWIAHCALYTGLTFHLRIQGFLPCEISLDMFVPAKMFCLVYKKLFITLFLLDSNDTLTKTIYLEKNMCTAQNDFKLICGTRHFVIKLFISKLKSLCFSILTSKFIVAGYNSKVKITRWLFSFIWMKNRLLHKPF